MNFVEELKQRIDNYNPADYTPADVTKNDMQKAYDDYKQIVDTITAEELQFLHILRGSRFGELRRHLVVAKKNQKAQLAFVRLNYDYHK